MMRCAGIRNRISRGAANTNRNRPDRDKLNRNKLEKQTAFVRRGCLFLIVMIAFAWFQGYEISLPRHRQ